MYTIYLKSGSNKCPMFGFWRHIKFNLYSTLLMDLHQPV
uniref:Uncharacterized protein n=1 Tax=Rhizophora mucronata TaxID=61149 RepID=A0A2P2PE88_RHIMU